MCVFVQTIHNGARRNNLLNLSNTSNLKKKKIKQ